MKLLEVYTRQELIDEALRFERENGRIPRKDEMMIYNGYPPIRQYLKIFGSWSNLLEVTSFKTKDEYNREFLSSELKRLQKDCGRIPSLSDLKLFKGYPSLNIYLRVFGSWNNALKETFGDFTRNKIYTKQELIDEAFRFQRENGRIPNKDDMMVFNGYPSFELYKKEFGSWSNTLMEIFGYIPEDRKACNKSYRNNYTEQELINELLRFEELYGRIPSIHELKVKDGWICRAEFIKVFGSWEDALNETPFKTRNIDINFFNPENMNLRKWYILGYIIGDGNVHGNRLSITSSEDDKENLYNIHQYMKLDTDVYSREGDGKRLYTISKSCKRWIEDLELFGVKPNKSFVTEIPTWYIYKKEEAAAICRGIFDADGSITVHSKSPVYPKFSVSGSEEVCDTYAFFLEKYCDIKCNPSKLKSIFHLQVNGTQCKRIYDFLYGHENFYIKRKKERFEKLINGTFTPENDVY